MLKALFEMQEPVLGIPKKDSPIMPQRAVTFMLVHDLGQVVHSLIVVRKHTAWNESQKLSPI